MLAARQLQRLGELLPLGGERVGALRQLRLLAFGRLAVELYAAQTILQLAHRALGLLERAARRRHRSARLLLGRRALPQLLAHCREPLLEARALRLCLRAIQRELTTKLFARSSLLFRALPTSAGVALALLRHS